MYSPAMRSKKPSADAGYAAAEWGSGSTIQSTETPNGNSRYQWSRALIGSRVIWECSPETLALWCVRTLNQSQKQ
jgi:hypothetical protein